MRRLLCSGLFILLVSTITSVSIETAAAQACPAGSTRVTFTCGGVFSTTTGKLLAAKSNYNQLCVSAAGSPAAGLGGTCGTVQQCNPGTITSSGLVGGPSHIQPSSYCPPTTPETDNPCPYYIACSGDVTCCVGGAGGAGGTAQASSVSGSQSSQGASTGTGSANLLTAPNLVGGKIVIIPPAPQNPAPKRMKVVEEKIPGFTIIDEKTAILAELNTPECPGGTSVSSSPPTGSNTSSY